MVSFSNRKTRRTWTPNVQTKRLWSDSFGTLLKLRVTTSVLKLIDKFGGLDNYLTSTPDERLASELGVSLKEQVLEQQRRKAAGEELLPVPKQTCDRFAALQAEQGQQRAQAA
eukprot:CAMPEP_0184308964 /NCGR_PEP_ID=MMETSP1049-20130417/17280_1 /TAXON_ID=77928 /ORGANISM="Proteomonas sulcata, Strain CCMP704" /LENGTH=112 /DNA_ID=CAMNT_0026621757 /DNA_START=21 /DNA_END=359 /DNA_ORIENTATION=-